MCVFLNLVPGKKLNGFLLIIIIIIVIIIIIAKPYSALSPSLNLDLASTASVGYNCVNGKIP